MNWDTTVKLTDLAIVFATIAGPVLAVQAQKWVERGREKTVRRIAIFRTLMANRANLLSPIFVEALNAVPVEFYGTGKRLKAINDAWKLYLDHHSVNLLSNDAWAMKRFDLFLDMLHLVSEFLGYSFSRPQLGRDIYAPQAHGDLEQDHNAIRTGLVKLLKGEISLPMAVKEFPSMSQLTPEQFAEFQKLLDESRKSGLPLIVPRQNQTS